MVDVNKPDDLMHVSPGGSGPGAQQFYRRPAGRDAREAEEGGGHTGTWEDDDSVSVGGLLAHEVTPAVQTALDELAARIEPLRRELEQSRAREARYRALVDTHSFLPIVNRGAFLRQLARVIKNLNQLSTAPTLLCLHVANAERIRVEHGRVALDAALVHVAELLTSTLHPTDVIGSLGGNDFGVILLIADMDAARDRGAALIGAIEERPLAWQGLTIPLTAAFGVRALEPRITADAALAAADQDLLRSRRSGDDIG